MSNVMSVMSVMSAPQATRPQDGLHPPGGGVRAPGHRGPGPDFRAPGPRARLPGHLPPGGVHFLTYTKDLPLFVPRSVSRSENAHFSHQNLPPERKSDVFFPEKSQTLPGKSVKNFVFF